MRRKAITFALCLTIVLCFSFVSIKLLSLQPDTSTFNTEWRYRFARYTWLRAVFGLHFDGDARADYLSPRYSEIIVEVDAQTGMLPVASVLRSFAERASMVTGKKVTLHYSDTSIPYTNSVSITEVDNIAKQYKHNLVPSSTAYLYVLFLSQSAANSNELATTHSEQSLLIYSDALSEFTQASPATLPNYIVGTLVHEFGHQLGLPHNSEQGCLMNEHAELSKTAKADPSQVNTDYCAYEKSLIQSMKW